jgi:ABC-type phosphate/phosphonate transport system ATPase subunit
LPKIKKASLDVLQTLNGKFNGQKVSFENILSQVFNEDDGTVQKLLKLVNTGASALKKASTMAAGKKDLKSFLRT